MPYDLEIGGQATYRSQICGGTLLVCSRPRSRCFPSYWRFDTFLEGYVHKNWEWKIFANNVFNKLYYDAFYQSGAPFVLVAPGRVWRRAGREILTSVLKSAPMLVCVPDILRKTEVAEFRGLMDAVAWEDGRSTAGAQSADGQEKRAIAA